ncbi:basic 7S globulin-like protein [Tanacetum coccineum]|uniref:Basic 7S globulin-like protein n=1 Tax=Tanacetum coccineum TaxID=301880 RepID=A0ABQ5DQW2_9ASTR
MTSSLLMCLINKLFRESLKCTWWHSNTLLLQDATLTEKSPEAPRLVKILDEILDMRDDGDVLLSKKVKLEMMGVSKVYGSPQVFALCLPSCQNTTASGVAFFNTHGPYYFTSGIDLSSHLIYTPLIVNPIGFTIITYYNYPSAEYFIGLTSIKINDKQVDINPSLLTIDNDGFGGTRLSTITPYTTLHTSIYRPFIQLFINESRALNLSISTNPVSPFEVCFNASDVHETWFGPEVPVIDLVMHSEDVFWKVYGWNTMVKVDGEIGESLWCLGFVDGGDEARTSVVIGGRQMEDNLLQFDLVNERFGFSSVLAHQTFCIEFNFTDGYM